MFGSKILETAIGLVFIYLMFSLICSAIQEFFAQLLNTRAKKMKEFLISILGEENVKEIYAHPLLKTIQETEHIRTLIRGKNAKSDPAFIDSEHFVEAVFQVLAEKGAEFANDGDLKKKLEEGINQFLKTSNISEDKRKATHHILVSFFEKAKAEAEKEVNKLKSEIKEKADEGIQLAANEAAKINATITKFKETLQSWFDKSMTDLSILYKGRVRFVIFIVALLVCTVFNADTIMISRSIYIDDATRSKIVDMAVLDTKSEIINSTIPATTPDEHASSPSTTSTVESQSKDGKSSADVLKEKLDTYMAKVGETGLPMGWNLGKKQSEDIKGLPVGLWEILFKIFGILITATAVSMGAPFWFDALKKLIDIRNQVKK